MTLLLDINRELLMEVMKIQAAQVEAKKDDTVPAASSPERGDKEQTEQEKAEKEKSEKEKAEKSKPSSREYFEYVLLRNSVDLKANYPKLYAPTSSQPSISRSHSRPLA